jgi:methionyl aminopeptidase
VITIKSEDEIKIMREAGRIVAQTLQKLVDACRPGVVAKDLDKLVRKEYARIDCVPTFLGYAHPPYPATLCFSVNDELVHGIPDKQVIREGDLISIDLGATYKGFVGDSAVTFVVGEPTEEQQRLIDVTRESLWVGIRAAHAGVKLGVVSNAIGEYIESHGYGVVRQYVGHGVGRQMHEEPQVPNYGPPDRGVMLRKGMVLALEPMVTVGDYHTKVHEDGWTVSTVDGSLCAHFEHTIAITDGEAEVLTLP